MPRARRPHIRGSALLLAASLTLAACGEDAPPSEVTPPADDGVIRLTDAQVAVAALRWESVSPEPLRQTVRVPGSVNPADTAQATVGSIVEGRVVRVRVLPGDRVRAGQALVEIHSHELSDAQAALTQAEAQLEYHREAAQRAERLHEAGAISLEELQRRRADLRGAVAEEARAIEMVEHLYPTPDGNTSAIAPQNGTVFAVTARPGQVVVPGTPLVHLGSTEVLWVTAFVPESTSANLQAGDVVDVSFQIPAGGTARARLVRVGRYVDPDNRSVEMRFELLDPPADVRPGAFATVEVTTTSSFTGVELPEAAAVRMGADDVVFVALGEGRFEPRVVTVRPLRAGFVAVQGLEEGLQVVMEGAYFLKSAAEAGGEEGEEG
jgi:RND family efflux transporter MFP subunit